MSPASKQVAPQAMPLHTRVRKLLGRVRRGFGWDTFEIFALVAVVSNGLSWGFITWVIYLALPFSLHPSLVVLPFAALFSASVAVTASTFKKYL